MSTSTSTSLFPSLTGLLRVHRSALIAVSILGLVLGIAALVWPRASLYTIAILFGAYLLASGIFRIVAAFTAPLLTTGQRWLTGLLGVLVVVAGYLALSNLFTSLLAIGLLIGIAWISEGILDISASAGGALKPAWLGWVSGILSIIAGFVCFFLPGLAVNVFITVAAFLLIFVSLSTLLTLPRKHKDA
ncbi:MAG: DUF308 domain-containing protein [Lacisediminihabitans sp.]